MTLLLMVLVPVIGAAAVLAAAWQGREAVRWTALGTVLATFVLSVDLAARFDPSRTDDSGRPVLFQSTIDIPWLSTAPSADAAASTDASAGAGFDVRFALGVDGISLWLVCLTALLMIPAVLVSWESIDERPAVFYALMLLLEAGMVGVFAALDIVLFYIFFEFTLIPLFFMIGLWGGYDRRWAARKFFIFTLAGSVLTFLGLLFIVLAHSWMSGAPRLVFSIPRLLEEIPQLVVSSAEHAALWRAAGPWLFAALFAGFAVKVPLFPFHTWLPLAHTEAPSAGSILLAGVLLKIGSYGFIRFLLPLVPAACLDAVGLVAVLSVVGIIYGALLALAQDDIKKLVAYSSVSHMGFCLLGLFAFNAPGLAGGMLQMVNHGLSTGALFALVGMLYERYHTRDLEAFGGLARKLPALSAVFVYVAFSSIGLPGLNGFTGEVLSLAGMFAVHPAYALLGLTGIILGAWYMLQLVAMTLYGRLREPPPEGLHFMPAGEAAPAAPSADAGHDRHHGHGGDAATHTSGHAVPDLTPREWFALAPLAAVILWIGLFPQFFLSRMQPSIDAVVKVVQQEQARRAESSLEITRND